ncbi:MAG: carbohydrate-binding domain-containing protein [Clostridiales bacterium]|nr:carbohydrate-binding domain-containing protein [Clostridiales bacterium]
MKIDRKTTALTGLTVCMAVFVLWFSVAGCSATTNAAGEIILADGASEVPSGVSVQGDIITVSLGGSYTVTGSLSDGSIIINSGDEVELILSGVSINSADSPAIYSLQGDLTITLADGTENTISDEGAYTEVDADGEPDAAVYCKDDLVISGSGTLNISANYCEAVTGKDTVTVESGNINIDSVGGGIKGKDSLTVDGGTFNLTTTGNGLYSSKGNVVINDGDITIVSEGKAIKGETVIELNGGTYNITSTDDAIHSNATVTVNSGTYTISTDDDAVHVETDLVVNDCDMLIEKCYEGLEGETITVNGGNVDLDASDDGLNAAGDNSSSDGGMNMGGGMPGMGSGGGPGGSEGFGNSSDDSSSSSEGSENKDGAVPTGFTDNKENKGITLSDTESGSAPDMSGESKPDTGSGSAPDMNGGNAPDMNSDSADEGSSSESSGRSGGRGGQPGGGMGGGPGGGGGMMDYDENSSIIINGGYLVVRASGDGIDSNGDITFNGGAVIVYGPESGGDGALDCGGSINYNGGTLLAIGSSGMAESPDSDGSECYSFIYNGDSIDADTLITITDSSSGEVLISTTTPKRISSIVFGSESLSDGMSVEIYTGGTLSGTSEEGVYSTGGTLSDGTLVETITLSGKSTSSGSSSFGGMGGGGHGMGGGHSKSENSGETSESKDSAGENNGETVGSEDSAKANSGNAPEGGKPGSDGGESLEGFGSGGGRPGGGNQSGNEPGQQQQ